VSFPQGFTSLLIAVPDTGYARFAGTRASAEELTSIFKSMDETGLLSPRRLLTGYIPNAAALEVIRNLAQKLKSDNPNLIYLLDRKFLVSSPLNKLFIF
jgi:pyridoxal/pyridoxine/pyridoxamine kinase